MYTFWYNTTYQQLHRQLKMHIQQERRMADSEMQYNRRTAIRRNEIANHAKAFLKAVTEIKHFTYHFKTDPALELLRIVVSIYVKGAFTQQKINRLQTMVFNDIASIFDPENKQMQLQKIWHRNQYRVWMLLGLCCLLKLMAAKKSHLIFNFILLVLSFVIGIEGIQCNMHIETEETLNDIILFTQDLIKLNEYPLAEMLPEQHFKYV